MTELDRSAGLDTHHAARHGSKPIRHDARLVLILLVLILTSLVVLPLVFLLPAA